MEKIKNLLISQPKPEAEKSPFFDLAEKHNLKLEFYQFIRVEGVSSKEYRQSKVKILEHTGVIFSSKIAIDHFFRICEESRVEIPDSMKYFCTSETIALYLQKYIVYRKRKIFHGRKTVDDLIEIIKVKHQSGKLLLTMLDTAYVNLAKKLDAVKIGHSQLSLYKTVSCDLRKVLGGKDHFDLLVFFTPAGIKSLFDNFPDFEQKDILVAVFGKNSQELAIEMGLRLDIVAPTPEAPSMTMAIDAYITDFVKNNRKKK